MKDNQAKYPQLRFKGFTDPWEERKLNEVAIFYNGQRIPIDSSLRKQGEYPYYGATGIIDYVEDYIFDGEFVLLAEDGANITMRNSPIAYLTQGKFWLNNHAHIMAMRDGSNNFLVQLLEKQNYEKYNSGTAQPKLNSQVVKSLNFLFPTKEEQKKIGSFFKQIDDTIALHQRKLAKLKELKQGYLQKLFPENGSKFPQLRFAGFADAWEERKLGDIVVFLNGRAYKQAELLDSGKYPVLRVGNFNTNDKWYYSDLELPAKNYADKGDLLYTWATAFGPHIWKGPKVIYHYHIWKVETTSDISKNFAIHLLDADQAQMTNSLNGSTMVHITKGTMENKIVTIPGISEQRNMARLLDQLDCTIALHQRKLEKLQELKKGYLQKMFC
ncbi:restriction endonuclease subunit S [Lactiplantibacillus plantarum]|uniref:restriction endonuclease subunit S n=1 Tax=Lactiplantibacillus plantarum TaxID=1590 RepID=UPI00223D78BF|nr:restriction endonuclease subunit S [Lactiplantibacillus plantarum]